MLDAAYGALKGVDASNSVIGGSTYTTGDIATLSWIQNLRLPTGRPPRMDMYAQNPFGWSAPSFSAPPSPDGEVQFSDLPQLGRWIDRYLRRGMPIFLSEWTVPTAIDNEFSFYVDAPVAASWISDALRLARSWNRIYALGWINVYDDGLCNPLQTAPPFPTSCGGLLTENGTPKPSFYAFKRG